MSVVYDGGRTRSRTLDPLIKSQLLYQLSYAPIAIAALIQLGKGRRLAKARRAGKRKGRARVELGARRRYAWAALGPTAVTRRPRRPRLQFFALSTSLFLPIHGIMARSFSPTSSIGWALARARIALNEVWLTRFSSIQSRVNLPDWMSSRTRFISALVLSVMMRGPETYSPYSAVLEIE